MAVVIVIVDIVAVLVPSLLGSLRSRFSVVVVVGDNDDDDDDAMLPFVLVFAEILFLNVEDDVTAAVVQT